MGGYAGLFLLVVAFAAQRHADAAATFSSFGKETCSPAALIKPASMQEIVSIIKGASARGEKVNAFGTRHASSNVNCADDVALDMSNFADIKIDPERMQATVGAGATHEQLLSTLQAQGYAVIHPSVKYTGLSVGGTLAVGAHSSSLLHPASISDQVISVTLVDGRGLVRMVDGAWLKAASVNIGALGVVVSVTISIVKDFKVRVEFEDHPDSILFDGQAIEWAKKHDYFEMSWFPSTDRVVVFKGTYVDINTPGNGRVDFVLTSTQDFLGAMEQASADRNTAFFCGSEAANRMGLAFGEVGLPQSFNGNGEFSSNITGSMKDATTVFCAKNTCAWDNPGLKFINRAIEFAFDLNTLPQALQATKSILSKRAWCGVAAEGVQIRFIKKSDNYLSPSNGRDVGVYEIIVPLRQQDNASHFGMAAMQEVYQTMSLQFNGRPHWGKNGRSTFAAPFPSMPELYPDWDKFMVVRRALDPKGVFENEFLRVLMRREELPKFKFCAINDQCVCDIDTHCADDQTCELTQIAGKDVGICVDRQA